MKYWLFKSDPDSFSIRDFEKAPKKTTCWDGVRNYQARNYLREAKVGDSVLFYHSQEKPPSVTGVCEVVKEAYPDPAAWSPKSKYFDPKASPENPIWAMVDVRLVRTFAQPIPIDLLRTQPELEGMELLRKGSRLSVQPVTSEQFAHVLKLADAQK